MAAPVEARFREIDPEVFQLRRQKRLQIRLIILWFTILSVWLAVPARANQPWTGRVTGVSQGDRLTVERQGQAVQVRLFALDCPELDQPFGEEARRFTASLCLDKEVLVKGVRIDDQGLVVARVVLTDQRELNSELLQAGLAWWVRHEAPGDIAYDRLQFAAQFLRKGLWADQEPIRPWEWRQGKRPSAEQARPEAGRTGQEAAPQPAPAAPESQSGQAEPGSEAKQTAELAVQALERPGLKWLDSPAAQVPAGQAWTARIELLNRLEPPAEVSLEVDWGDGQVETLRPEAGRFELSHVFFKGGQFRVRAVATASRDKEKASSEPLETALSVSLGPPSLELSVSGEDNRKTFQVKAASGSFLLAAWELDFGDGKEPALGQGEVDLRLVHVYPPRPGQEGAGDKTYTAVLRASDAKGNRFSRQVEAVVRPGAAASAPGGTAQPPPQEAENKQAEAGPEEVSGDLRLGSVSGPAEVEAGQEARYEVGVENPSGRPADGCQVALLVNGRKRETRTLNLGPGASLREALTFSPSRPGQAELRIVLIPPSGFSDADLANNVHDASLRVRPKPGALAQKPKPAEPLSGDLSLSEVRLLSQPVLIGRASTLAALIKNQSPHQLEGLKIVLAVDGRRAAEEVFDLRPEHASVVLLDFTPNKPGPRTIRLTVSGPAGFKDAEPANNVFEGRVEVLTALEDKGESAEERAASTEKKVEPPPEKAEPVKKKVEPPKAKAEPPKVEVVYADKKIEPPLAKVEPPKEKVEPPKAKVEPPKEKAESPKETVEPPQKKAALPPEKVEPQKEKVELPKERVEPTRDEVASAEKKVEPSLAKVEPPKEKAEPSKAKVEPLKGEVALAEKKAEPPQEKAPPPPEKVEPQKKKAESPKDKLEPPPPAEAPMLALSLGPVNLPGKAVQAGQAIQVLVPIRNAGQEAALDQTVVFTVDGRIRDKKVIEIGPDQTLEIRFDYTPEQTGRRKVRIELFPPEGRRVVEPERTIFRGQIRVSAPVEASKPTPVEQPKPVEAPRAELVPSEGFQDSDSGKDVAERAPEVKERPEPQTGEERGGDLVLSRTKLPSKSVGPGAKVEIVALVRNQSQVPMAGGAVVLSVDGQPVGRKPLDLPASGSTEVAFDYVPDGPGQRTVLLEVIPPDDFPDSRPENNRAEAGLSVLEPPAPAAAEPGRPPAGPPGGGRFTIQVAAYANQALARDLVKKLDERYGPGSGAITEYFDGQRNLYRVRAFLVSSFQAAKERLRQLNADGFGIGFVVPLD